MDGGLVTDLTLPGQLKGLQEHIETSSGAREARVSSVNTRRGRLRKACWLHTCPRIWRLLFARNEQATCKGARCRVDQQSPADSTEQTLCQAVRRWGPAARSPLYAAMLHSRFHRGHAGIPGPCDLSQNALMFRCRLRATKKRRVNSPTPSTIVVQMNHIPSLFWHPGTMF